MAWTNPRTWTDGELVTKAIMDPHVRDNLLALGPIQRIRKTADQTVTSSAVLVDDTHLQFAIAASEVWAGRFALFVTGATTGDISFALNAPAGATGIFTVIAPTQGLGTLTDSVRWDGFTSFGDANLCAPGTLSSTAPVSIIIDFNVDNAGTAGTFKLRWAQRVSDATATTVRKGSNLMAWKF